LAGDTIKRCLRIRGFLVPEKNREAPDLSSCQS
jgi:hypothetical protein